MPQFISPPSSSTAQPGRRRILIVGAVLFMIFITFRSVLGAWVDLLWFRSLGYSAVFWRSVSLEAGVFAVTTAVTFLLLYAAFAAIRHSHQADLPDVHTILVGGRPVTLPIASTLRILSLIIAIVVALFTGLSMMGDWPTIALFFSAPHAAGADPIFHKPLEFYLFTLPAWQLIDSWLLTVAFALVGVAILFLVLTSGSRALGEKRAAPVASPWRGLSLTAAFLLLVLAMNVYLDRFELLFERHTLFDGVNYTAAHITSGGYLLVSFALVLGALLAAYNAAREAHASLIAAAAIPGVLVYAVLSVVTWYVSSFIVKPNQLVREEPYIVHNIELTRQAFGLDRFSQHEFPAETSVDATDPDHNQATLQNIRLWDWHALQDTLRQVQEIRTYYDFPDIDIDRYRINGAMREVMLAQRELEINKLPVSSRNWINEKLIYTHGYGITMNPVNGFTPEGLPDLLLSNMPVQSTVLGLQVTRPELYFGEATNTDVYVKTHQKEFDYPQGQANTLTSYEGSGGIAIGGFFRRILLATDRGDLGTLPFSDDVTPDSRLLLHRNIRERVARLAPFLTYDQDPYMVVGDDGRLSWIIDAYTTSDSYPYSTHYALGDDTVNYMRNSVKVVIDAYNGSVTFYVFDPADPIIAAYRKLFPTLFTDASRMPAELRRHIRYPETIFNLQSEVYGLYHMTNPEVFFNREDLWTVATETAADDSGQQTAAPMHPNFVLMKLPGGSTEEFVEILPFTPANRNNLIGWIAARSDGDAYGTAAVYNFPKTRLIDGPQQIEARIDQNAQLSGQLTLWNQQGSHVLRGSLLVIPMGKALLYAEPIYLQAQQSPMPELRLVVLALQDKLAYGTTFQAALASLYGTDVSTLTPSAASTAPSAAPPSREANSAPPSMQALIAQASRDFEDYQHLTAAGHLAEAGQKLDSLKSTLARLNGLTGTH